jgi:hypothetical protein
MAIQGWSNSKALWPSLTLIGVIGLAIGVRLLVVRGLDAPLWGDSYQHTMIAQLLVEHGGLFDSWQPYVALDRFTYHYGFHTAAAVVHWLTRLSVLEATIWTGQLLNGLAVLAIYPLAVRVTGSRWAGVWAVLFAGLLSPMPMSYVNWGRYTQLAGLAILPTAVWLTWENVEASTRQWPSLTLASVLGAGLALTHYRVLLFYAAFVVALLLVSLGRRGQETFSRLAVIGAGALLLFLPWFVNAFGSQIMRMLGLQLTTLPSQAHPFLHEYNAIGSLGSYLSPVWWLGLALGLGMGLWSRLKGVLVVAIWWLLILIMANPEWMHLPGAGVLTNFAVFIAAFLPAALFTGVLVARAMRALNVRGWGPPAATLFMLAVGLWGAWQRTGDLDPIQHALVTRPDMRAAAWIRDNTPADSRFLVNSFFAFGGGAVVGSDGGWWLPLLADRSTTVPPLSYASELGPESDLSQRVSAVGKAMLEYEPEDPEFVAVLQDQGVTHVYIGQRQGGVNHPGEGILQPEELIASRHYDLVYHEDLVWVFSLTP